MEENQSICLNIKMTPFTAELPEDDSSNSFHLTVIESNDTWRTLHSQGVP